MIPPLDLARLPVIKPQAIGLDPAAPARRPGCASVAVCWVTLVTIGPNVVLVPWTYRLELN
jgi:hypothetical protein